MHITETFKMKNQTQLYGEYTGKIWYDGLALYIQGNNEKWVYCGRALTKNSPKNNYFDTLPIFHAWQVIHKFVMYK